MRLDDAFRNDPQELKRMSVELPHGGRIPLSAVAEVVESSGPNTINRENVRRRIIVQCNTAGRDLSSVVAEIQQRLAPIQASLPVGYFLQYSGQFESQQSAMRTIGLLSLVSLACMLLTLYTLFHSLNLSLQVLAALPMAAIGAVAALVVTGQSLTRGQHGGLHFAGRHRLAERHSSDRSLLAPDAPRGRAVHAANDPAGRPGAARAHADDGPHGRHRLGAAGPARPVSPGRKSFTPWPPSSWVGWSSSTLLDFFVRPALFWSFGRKAAMRAITHELRQPDLTDAEPASPSQPHTKLAEHGRLRVGQQLVEGLDGHGG